MSACSPWGAGWSPPPSASPPRRAAAGAAPGAPHAGPHGGWRRNAAHRDDKCEEWAVNCGETRRRGIGFRPAKQPRNRRYSGRGVRFAGRGKFFCGLGEYAGSVLAGKLGRARILAGIFAGRAFCGVC